MWSPFLTIKEWDMEELIRLNKYLSEAGVCSRRAADAAIEAGKVTVNGKPATMGQKVGPRDKVVFDGKAVVAEDTPVIIAYNKPVGIVCTAEKREKNNIVDCINYPVRIYPIGRLDKDSHGLILLTNQGDLVNKIMRGSNYHDKEYIVRVDKEITAEFIKTMAAGIYLKELDATTRPCQIKKLSKFTFSIILTQGLNRQIRRMCEACGYRVRDLKRVRIMNINLGDLPEGKYRDLSTGELKKLNELIADSSNGPRREKR